MAQLVREETMKRCLVLGGGGFIGSHLAKRLKSRGHYVAVADQDDSKFDELRTADIDDLFIMDLTQRSGVQGLFCFHKAFDEVYQLAADMGGAGYIFSGEHDADLMRNSALINLQVAECASYFKAGKLFYSSSACIYPQGIQGDTANPGLKETDAYPADPDSSYGWEKLFSERLYLAYARNHGLNVRIARFHNVFGPMGAYDGGREKAPAAICRKVAMAPPNGAIEIWGDGEQTRSFLYIDDCLDGVEALMASECREPVNIGSDEMVSINDLAKMTMDVAGKKLTIKHIDGPLGVRGRNSDNTFAKAVIGWSPKIPLRDGIEKTYRWVESQVKSR